MVILIFFDTTNCVEVFENKRNILNTHFCNKRDAKTMFDAGQFTLCITDRKRHFEKFLFEQIKLVW